MAIGELFRLVFTALVIYVLVGIGLFILSGKGFTNLFSVNGFVHILYWPILLKDALQAY